MKQLNIDVNGIETHYLYSEPQNNKPNFLILHGWGGKSESWRNVGDILSKSGFGVYVPDLPGFGATTLPKVFSIHDYVKHLSRFITVLGIKNIILLGHSNGGAIATELTNTQKHDIHTLILNNSAGVRNNLRRRIKRFILKPIAIILKFFSFLPFYPFIRKVLYRIIGSSDYTQSEKSHLYLKETYLNMIGSDMTEEFHKIDVKTILIRGENDTSTPLSDGRYIRLNIKDSQLVTIAKQGHSIHLENPIGLCNTILKNI